MALKVLLIPAGRLKVDAMIARTIKQKHDDAKAVAGDVIIMFRMGDFYEAYCEDAKILSRVLGLTLVSRGKGDEAMPMVGFPWIYFEKNVAVLKSVGLRFSVCEE